VVFDRDGFAKGQPIAVDSSLSRIAFKVENRSGDVHLTQLELRVAGAATYEVAADNRRLQPVQTASGIRVEIPVSASGANVTLTRR
jgi:hypothetical protein